MNDTVSTQELLCPTGCSSERWSSPSGKLGDAVRSETLKQPTCRVSLPSRKLHHTHLCCWCKKKLLLHCKFFNNTKLQQGCSKIAWKVQLISVMLAQKWDFSSQKCSINPIISKAYHLYFGCQTGDQENGWPPPPKNIYICLFLTAIGLTPGGSSPVHIYTQTIHWTTQLNRIHRTEHT
jgi:hypothetical protein